MIYIAVGELAALVAVVACFARLTMSQQRAHARREDLLVNQLLHAAGKSWQPPPASDRENPDRPPRDWTASPEQLPLNQ